MANIDTGLTKKENGKQSLAQWLDTMRPQVERALPQHMKADRFLRVVLTTLRTNPKLAACDPSTFLAAMMTAAQLGLEVNTPLGESYIIPYGKDANFQIGYKGLIELAYRTRMYKDIDALEVYKNDVFDYEYGDKKYLKHKPAKKPEGEPVYYYAIYELVNGGQRFRVWPKEKVITHAEKFSQSFKKKTDSPWRSDFDSMAKKTVLIDLLRYAPKSIEVSRALAVDETTKKDISEDMDLVPAIDDDVIEAEATLSEEEQLGLEQAVEGDE